MLNELSPPGRILVQKVIDLENEKIHIRETANVVPAIVNVVRELAK
ncbi:hypothetical protein [Streptomyces sp. UH6]|nr:hypothetical protein [Streptomyces sp. UH6]NYV73204.1 hypothetical protein [Streptomyces sp. UH6]